jgi:ABC-type branched-subunit amino acid transport system substrate-binding protein
VSTTIPKIKQGLAGLTQIHLLAGSILLLVFGCTVFPQRRLTPPENRGKQIYVQGKSSSNREILAYMGEASIEVPGSAMPCANCHGLDGRGKPEGGVDPSDLRWESLTKPYALANPNGRKRPPYTDRGLELAITRGTDPAGNKLLPVMPRYQMSREELSDLVLYLKRLGEDRDPGISEDKIVLGTVIPTKGALAGLGQAVKAATTAYFQELNSQGGIYNRRFELKFVEAADSAAATRDNVDRFLKTEQVFAMSGAFIAGSEKEILKLVEENEVPLIGPMTLLPQAGFPVNRHVFYLLSGLDGQARVLIDFAAKRSELKNSGVAVVAPQSDIRAMVIEAIKGESQKTGLPAPEVERYASGHFAAEETAKKLKQSGRDAVFFLGESEEALALMKEAEKLNWFPAFYLPAAIAGSKLFEAPLGFKNKLFFSFPTTPADQTAAGTKAFRDLAEKYKLPAEHLAAQLQACSAANILVEGLKRAGRDLSRERLITALEGLDRFETGSTPPITYGPNRRIGALGAYVIMVDLEKKKFEPASGWIGLD